MGYMYNISTSAFNGDIMLQKHNHKLPLYLLLILFLLASCAATNTSINSSYSTKSGKTLYITETHPIGMSLSDIKIESQGFKHNFSEVLKDRDPIANVMVADLDQNGFDEFYIVTVAAGSGSYGNIIGLASNRDKSLSFIHFPEFNSEDELFTGYMGHDSFKIEGNLLVRTFPLIANNHIGTLENIRQVNYELVPGEASWQLRVVGDQ